jgi:DNA-binding MarR family transcriptional regulator
MSPPLHDTLKEWMHLVMRHSIHNFMRFARQRGYSTPQLNTLIRLHHKGHCGVSDLSEETGVTNAAISQLLEKMVQQGWVARSEDPQDRRQKVIELTAAGQQVVQESLSARQSWLNQLVETLTLEEQQQINTALQLLIRKAALLDDNQAP